VILDLEEAGELTGPITRHPGRGDCTDGTGQDWDVKRFRDDVARPAFDVAFALQRILLEVKCGERVIVDLTGLTDPTHRHALRQAAESAGLAADVRWYE
jgi:hypothetical protein